MSDSNRRNRNRDWDWNEDDAARARRKDWGDNPRDYDVDAPRGNEWFDDSGTGGNQGRYGRGDAYNQQRGSRGYNRQNADEDDERGRGGQGRFRSGQDNDYGQGSSDRGNYGDREYDADLPRRDFGQYTEPDAYWGREYTRGLREVGEEWRRPGQHTGRGPQGYQRADERILEDVNERLTQHGGIDATNIQVNVSQGEVTLNGTVDSRRTKRMAEDTVENISGVKHVQNNLRVQEGNARGTTQNDRSNNQMSESKQPAAQNKNGHAVKTTL